MLPKSLAELDTDMARRVARDALFAIMNLRHDTELGPFESPLADVVKEYARNSKVDVNRPISAKDRLKLLSAATDALSTIAVGDLRPRDVDEMSGNLGILKPNEYEIKDHDYDWFELGLDRARVHTTVQHADAYQHVLPHRRQVQENKGSLLSLFVRQLNRGGDEPAHWCLAIAARVGDTLAVSSAYHVFQDDLDLDAAQGRPIDLLTAFADKYGVAMFIDGESIGRVIVNREFPRADGFRIDFEGGSSATVRTDGRVSLSLPEGSKIIDGSILVPPGSPVRMAFGMYATPLLEPMVMAVTYGFSLNIDLYLGSLDKRGIPYRRSERRK